MYHILGIHSLPFFSHAFLSSFPVSFLYPTSKCWVSCLGQVLHQVLALRQWTCRRALALLDVYLGGGPVPSADDLRRPGPRGLLRHHFTTGQWVPRVAACSFSYFRSVPIPPIIFRYIITIITQTFPYMLNYLIITTRETCIRFAFLQIFIGVQH